MKKISLFGLSSIFVFVFATGLLAKPDLKTYPDAFSKDDIAIQVGLGLMHTGVYGDTVVPPICVSMDFAKPIGGLPFSIGGYVGYAQSEDEYSFFTYSVKWTYTYYILGARVAYHFNFKVKNLDTYAGILTGYSVVSVEEETSGYAYASGSSEGSFFNVGGFAGARYFFTSNLAGFAEIGYGVSILSFGLTYKF